MFSVSLCLLEDSKGCEGDSAPEAGRGSPRCRAGTRQDLGREGQFCSSVSRADRVFEAIRRAKWHATGVLGGGWCAGDREPRLAAPAVPAARASAHSQNQGTRPLGQCRAGQEMEIRTDCEQQMLGMGSAKARPAAAVGRQRERALGEGGGRGIANNSCIGVGTEATGQDLGRSRSFGDVDGWEMEETERESERGSRGGETQKAKAGWVERHAGPGTRCLPTLSKCTSRWPPPHISRRQQV
jgi:hypothetical protein